MAKSALPDKFRDVDHLEEVMTEPYPELVSDLQSLTGDIIVLGIGGKMGPTLARMAKRAAPSKRVIGVARFSEPGLRESLTAHGIECVAADLLDRQAVAGLPEAANVVYMAGRKFGSQGAEDLTWAMNTYAPALVVERFRNSRIVYFSTGCVYPYVPVFSGGATEDIPTIPPAGDYANSCVGRERMFQYGARAYGTKGAAFRLNYAIDMRYGVLYDVATKVLAGKPIDISTGHVNVIWQGDANAMALRTLAHAAAPNLALNVSGPETLSIRWLAEAFGRRFDRKPSFEGVEASSCWLVNSSRAMALFGYPRVPLARLIDWTAAWVAGGGRSLGKETHYGVRDGVF